MEVSRPLQHSAFKQSVDERQVPTGECRTGRESVCMCIGVQNSAAMAVQRATCSSILASAISSQRCRMQRVHISAA